MAKIIPIFFAIAYQAKAAMPGALVSIGKEQRVATAQEMQEVKEFVATFFVQAKKGFNPLYQWLCKKRPLHCISKEEVLLEFLSLSFLVGQDVSEYKIVDQMIDDTSIDMNEAVTIKDPGGRSSLYFAVQLNNKKIIKKLLQWGANPFLYYSSGQDEQRSIIELAYQMKLFKEGDSLKPITDFFSDLLGYDEGIEIFEAYLPAKQEWFLHALQFDDKRIINHLVNKAPDVDLNTRFGPLERTALMMAVISGRKVSVETFLKNGVDIKMENIEGKTAYDFAEKMVSLSRQYGDGKQCQIYRDIKKLLKEEPGRRYQERRLQEDQERADQVYEELCAQEEKKQEPQLKKTKKQLQQYFKRKKKRQKKLKTDLCQEIQAMHQRNSDAKKFYEKHLMKWSFEVLKQYAIEQQELEQSAKFFHRKQVLQKCLQRLSEYAQCQKENKEKSLCLKQTQQRRKSERRRRRRLGWRKKRVEKQQAIPGKSTIQRRTFLQEEEKEGSDCPVYPLHIVRYLGIDFLKTLDQ